MNTVTVNINGVEYNLRGKEDEKYLFDVAAYVDNKIREISNSNKKLSISSAAVLTAVNIADELFKCDLEISNITKKKNSLEERHLTLKERLRELKIGIDDTAKNKAIEIESLKNLIFQMEEQLKNKNTLIKENEELNKKVVKLIEDNNTHTTQILSLENENSTFRNKNESLQNKIKKYEVDMKNMIDVSEYNKAILKAKDTEKQISTIKVENMILKNKLNDNSNKLKNLRVENTELKSIENNLKNTIAMKEAEINDNRNENEEELKSLKAQINIIEKELKDKMSENTLLKNKNKEIKFQLHNFKYKVLDLEKKLVDTQINLALEKKDKNPLLR